MTNRRGKIRNYPLLSISQREPAFVLHRFQKAVGVGYVNGPYESWVYKEGVRVKQGNPAYYYRVNGYEKVKEVAILLWPWLSPVKRAQAKRVLKAYEAVH